MTLAQIYREFYRIGLALDGRGRLIARGSASSNMKALQWLKANREHAIERLRREGWDGYAGEK